MFKRIALAGALALAVISGAEAQTASVTISNGAYTLLGSGSLHVANSTTQAVDVCVAASAPAAATRCEIMLGGVSKDFKTNLNVYAQAIQPGASFALTAAPIVDGAPTANPVYSNVQTCTTAAAALPSAALTNGAVLTADAANTGKIYIGGPGVTTTTGYPLVAGQSISYGPTSLSMIDMICANTTDVLHFTGN